MKRNRLMYLFGLSVILWPILTSTIDSYPKPHPQEIQLHDLSAFNNPGKTWRVASDVEVDLTKDGYLTVTDGTGLLVNQTSKRNSGTDLYTASEYGDMELELEFLMPLNGNSGLYFQGRYELQLADSWHVLRPTSSSNGGIYNLVPPRVNASKAPGLWQHVKVLFQAPRFNSNGEKTENARFLRVELNGVLIQENVEVFKPTPGSVSKQEVAKAPLRIQGDHGSVAYRNIRISNSIQQPQERGNSKDPILVDAPETTILRSFINSSATDKIVHAASVGSPQNVHYTYDLDNGALALMWRGGFLDATPMWDDRGNGVSIPRGAVLKLGKPGLFVAKLADMDSKWVTDTTGTNFRPKGYSINAKGEPTFNYQIYGTVVQDHIRAMEDGRGLQRSIKVENSNNLYVQLAIADQIAEISSGNYIVGEKEYYLILDNPKKNKAFIRKTQGKMELIVPIQQELDYSLLF